MWRGRFLLALGLTAGLILSGCSSQAKDSPEVEVTPVKVAPVQRARMSFPVHTGGLVASRAESKLSFKIGGIVERIPVDEGQRVRKGQLLARLNLSEIQARVQQARSAYEKAQRDLERAQRLYADSVATLEQVQNATTAVEVAKAQLEIAEFNLRHARITAPTDGRILKRFVEANEMVAPGQPIFLFGTAGKEWVVRVGISDRDIVRLQLGDSATVYLDAYPGEAFPAVVNEIAEALDPRSATFEVELSLIADHRRLLSGMMARVEIFPSVKQEFALVPIDALVEADGDQGVLFALEDDGRTVRKVSATIARILERKIAVKSGLEGVTSVITDGAAYLSDGETVVVQ